MLSFIYLGQLPGRESAYSYVNEAYNFFFYTVHTLQDCLEPGVRWAVKNVLSFECGIAVFIFRGGGTVVTC